MQAVTNRVRKTEEDPWKEEEEKDEKGKTEREIVRAEALAVKGEKDRGREGGKSGAHNSFFQYQ